MNEILADYGVLGLWVAYSIIRERWLLSKIEELSLRFDGERTAWNRERMAWIRMVGKKLDVSDATIMEIMDKRN
ncbi:MAG: hypothetical protein Unbinned4098contig1000_15 [Prokaryotic dsDNA virus sp.]|nr:MAG: hypothetical protein Unbinned4098contig1000_15 [Prokaryotic dsDNA virus sp.]|tara:strand:- start:315 stop:536 length:222 start_codon:yes stop_codon:yes gene_type:complete